MKQLSILIPARNEEFLVRTIEDILEHKRGETEILVGLDGKWSDPGIPQHPDVNVLYYPESIGQRAMTNQLCKLSKAKYVMKVDAHCSFDEGFDVKLIADMQDDWTVVPTMRNLYAFDWVCACGFEHYQDKGSVCPRCKATMTKRMKWKPRPGTRNNSYCFDSEPHFQYFTEFSKRPEGQGDLTETMSLQGSCFMLTRDKYWELNICDENFGSWGSQGIEVAVKTWLSGGRVMVNKKTWYAHMFRTKAVNDFGFPYELSGRQVEHAKKTAKDLFFNNKWDKATRPLSWLVERFWPIPGWSEDDLKRLKEMV